MFGGEPLVSSGSVVAALMDAWEVLTSSGIGSTSSRVGVMVMTSSAIDMGPRETNLTV